MDSSAPYSSRSVPLWLPESQPISSSVAPAWDYGREPPMEVLAALRELRHDLPRLEHKLDTIRDSSLRGSDVREQLDFSEPLSNLSVDMAALRDASRTRFEAIEERLAALARTLALLTERLDKPKPARAAPPAVIDEPVEWGRAKPSKVVPLEAEYRPASPFRALPRQTNTRARSISPDPRITKRQRQSDIHGASAGAVMTPAKKVESARPSSGFTLPDWASAEVQAIPLPIPEAQGFTSLVEAYRRASRNEKLKSVSLPNVAGDLLRLDPDIYSRHGVTQWKQFLPIAQRYIAIYLVLPDTANAEHDLKRSNGGGGHLQIRDLAHPYNARVVEPPSLDAQRQQLLGGDVLRREIQPTWAKATAHEEAVETAPQTALSLRLGSLPSYEEAWRDRPWYEERFPDLVEPLTPEWEERFSRPETFFCLIDAIRLYSIPADQTVNAGKVHNALRQSMGDEYEYCLRAVNGTQRFYGVASKLINIARARMEWKQNFLIFRGDLDRLFFEEKHNQA